MRRSKSNPAKYAKNYRKISQRQMTAPFNNDKDETIKAQEEMDRIETLLSVDDRKKPQTPKSQHEILLSKELLEESGNQNHYGETTTADCLVLPPASKKKKKTRKTAVVLTATEIKQAQQQRKQLSRKLQQLAQRAQQKDKRAALYEQLRSTAIDTSSSLLQSSATLGQKETTKQRLRRAKQKESVGLTLTEEEHDLLYRPRKRDRNDQQGLPPATPKAKDQQSAVDSMIDKKQTASPETLSSSKRRKEDKSPTDDDQQRNQKPPPVSAVSTASDKETPTPAAKGSAPQLSAAAQMMASFHHLKDNSACTDTKQNKSSLEDEINQKPNPLRKPYVPSTPIALEIPKTTTTPPNMMPSNSNRPILHRPPDVIAIRNELPVVAMELEVMDAIQQHDVVILCAETGSGKSTQVPQFLYEASHNKAHGPVAITQPRRVAAIATANRVAYELWGTKAITKKNNPVAYATRYETAGRGPDTQITYMTDGILLQEIRTDLLLRNYNTVILDEAHERNLNTDVLIGLLKLSLQVRNATEELPPLKVIVMSATLRVQDFTGIFPQAGIVQVPGRTFPVTIHHSKETELDKYDDVVFHKTCKIHRKLPPGGILVFLTGKQEITRMVRRLQRALTDVKKPAATSADVEIPIDDCLPRDMDDDEVDGDLYSPNDELDESGFATNLDDVSGNDTPLKAHILPLYSLLSSEEQAKVFAAAPEGHRLIVVATNIAETSLTIPGISYVVDSGRQKSLNYGNNGVASYDITWISQAAAGQRAGRAGRTGPGHCYRVYSSSLYSRHMDKHELPEVLSRPLEDVVLSMKALGVSNISDFPFPTPPDKGQIHTAVKLLSHLGCLDLANPRYADGEITRLGSAIAKLPLGVRHGKMLLVAAEAGVVDYAIVMIAVLSEPTSPFVVHGQNVQVEDDEEEEVADEDASMKRKKKKVTLWSHKDGDVLAAMHAAGAYAFAGRGAGGASEKLAYRRFCEENSLHAVVMNRIHTMRRHLAKLVKLRLRGAEGVAPRTGKFLSAMKPPSRVEMDLLRQSIASGLLDNVAMLAPLGSIAGDHPYSLRSAFISCSSSNKEPLFMDRNCVLFSRDSRQLPKWICYETLTRKTLKDGSPVAIMKRITPINPSWLGLLAIGSELLTLGEPVPSPQPIYNRKVDAVQCSVRTEFGNYGWEIASVRRDMYAALQTGKSAYFGPDDSFRWFARFLLEGKVIDGLEDISTLLNDSPGTITQRTSSTKVSLLVAALSAEGIDTAEELSKHWARVNDKFLFNVMRRWVDAEKSPEFKTMWIACVKATKRRWERNDVGTNPKKRPHIRENSSV